MATGQESSRQRTQGLRLRFGGQLLDEVSQVHHAPCCSRNEREGGEKADEGVRVSLECSAIRQEQFTEELSTLNTSRNENSFLGNHILVVTSATSLRGSHPVK